MDWHLITVTWSTVLPQSQRVTPWTSSSRCTGGRLKGSAGHFDATWQIFPTSLCSSWLPASLSGHKRNDWRPHPSWQVHMEVQVGLFCSDSHYNCLTTTFGLCEEEAYFWPDSLYCLQVRQWGTRKCHKLLFIQQRSEVEIHQCNIPCPESIRVPTSKRETGWNRCCHLGYSKQEAQAHDPLYSIQKLQWTVLKGKQFEKIALFAWHITLLPFF